MTTDYNSFIEIFTGINLAYAGSERFRDYIDEKIKSIFSATKDLRNVFERNKALNNSGPYEAYIQELYPMMEEKGSKIIDGVTDRINCIEIFKSAFLFCSGYCLVFLICSASMNNGIHVNESRAILLLLSIVTIVYSLAIVLMSIFKRSNKKIKAYKPVLILLLTIIVAIIISRYECTPYVEQFLLRICNVDRKYFYYLSISAAVSPIVLHLMRSLVLLFLAWLITRPIYLIARAVNNELEEINYKLYKINIPKKRMSTKLFYSTVFTILKERHDKKINRKNKKEN